MKGNQFEQTGTKEICAEKCLFIMSSCFSKYFYFRARNKWSEFEAHYCWTAVSKKTDPLASVVLELCEEMLRHSACFLSKAVPVCWYHFWQPNTANGINGVIVNLTFRWPRIVINSCNKTNYLKHAREDTVLEDIKSIKIRNSKKVGQNRDRWKKVVEQARTLYKLQRLIRRRRRRRRRRPTRCTNFSNLFLE